MNNSKSSQKENKQRHPSRLSSWIRRPPWWYDALRPLFDPPGKLLGTYIKTGQVVVELACANGYYTFPIADRVGPTGKVISVDICEPCIRKIQRKAIARGYTNIEAHACSAAEMKFITDRTVDFVFADGLLCTMETDRDFAVEEIKRILKTSGQAFINIGAHPPWGYVDEAEWNSIMKGFNVIAGGNYQEMWSLVSLLN